MPNYYLRFLSFETHSLEVASSVLCLPQLEQLLFPLTLYVDEEKKIVFNSANEFNLLELSKQYDDDLTFRIYLHSSSEIELSVSIHKAAGNELIFPHALGLSFSDLNFRSEEVDIQLIKTLFNEIIPVFKPFSGVLYEKSTSLRLMDNGFYDGFSMQVDNHTYTFEIAWVSYCGPEQLEFAGRKRFDNLQNCAEVYDLHDGLMIVLQEEPYDDDNPEHRQRLEQLIGELNCRELMS